MIAPDVDLAALDARLSRLIIPIVAMARVTPDALIAHLIEPELDEITKGQIHIRYQSARKTAQSITTELNHLKKTLATIEHDATQLESLHLIFTQITGIGETEMEAIRELPYDYAEDDLRKIRNTHRAGRLTARIAAKETELAQLKAAAKTLAAAAAPTR